jgi:hypothetical protein
MDNSRLLNISLLYIVAGALFLDGCIKLHPPNAEDLMSAQSQL